MANRVRNFDYLGLHDEDFEELTFLLGRLEEPDLVRPTAPDLGLDGVVLGDGGAPARRGFQSKHFTTPSPSWPQCRKSLDDAVANYHVKHVTFTFPRDLTGKQIQKFEKELADRHPDVKVDFWGASQLTARLLGSKEGDQIARHIFGIDEYARMSQLIRAQQDLDTGSQVISALGATNNRFSDDPYYDYWIGTRPPSASPSTLDAPLEDGAVMRLELADEHGVYSIDAYAKPAALAADRLPKGTLRLAGEDAIRRFQEFQRVGGELELPDVRIEWEYSPKHIAEFLGADVDEGSIVLRSEPVLELRPMRVEFDTTTGNLFMDFDMQPTAPPAEWEFALAGQRGGMALQLSLRRRGAGAELNLNWSWRMDASHSADEHLVGLRLLEAAAGKGDVRIIDAQSGEVLSVAASPEEPFDETMKILKRVLEDIVALESWLGGKIEVPEQITGIDAKTLRQAVALIEGVERTWNGLNFTLSRDPGADALAEGGILQVRQPFSIDLFGRRYDLGDVATYVSGFEATSTEAVSGGRKFVLRPAMPDSKMHARLEHPSWSESPSEQPAA